MQPRGQLWFALQHICEDFRAYSGLAEKDAMQTLVIVLRNLLAEQEGVLKGLQDSSGGDVARSGPMPPTT